jgi:hypothetical protein
MPGLLPLASSRAGSLPRSGLGLSLAGPAGYGLVSLLLRARATLRPPSHARSRAEAAAIVALSTWLSQNLLNYDGPYVPVIVIMISDSHTYVPHNLKGMLSSEHDSITGVLQYYNSLFKITSE